MQRHQPRALKQGSDTDWQIAENEARLSVQHNAQCHCSLPQQSCCFPERLRESRSFLWHSSVCQQHALTGCLLLIFPFFSEKTFCLKLLNTLNIYLSYTSNKEVKNKYPLAGALCRWIHDWARTTDWNNHNCIYWEKKKRPKSMFKEPWNPSLQYLPCRQAIRNLK